MAKQSKNSREYKQILDQLKRRDFRPVYVLHGDEPYFSDLIANYLLENVVPEEMRAFNQFLLYGRDVNIGQLVDLLSRSPINSTHLLVVVREAQDMRNLEPLAEYMQMPIESTILVLNFSAKIKPGRGKGSAMQKILSAVPKVGILAEFAELRDYEVSSWVEEYLKGRGYTITPQAAEFLVYQMGTDLSSIANQLDKLLVTLPSEEKEIRVDQLSDTIGVSRDFNPFELTRAIGQGNYYEANRIAVNMAANPKANNISLLLSTIHGYFTKVFLFGLLSGRISRQELAARLRVHPFFLNEYEQAARRYNSARCLHIFSELRALDLRTKGFGAEPITLEDALKETLTRVMR